MNKDYARPTVQAGGPGRTAAPVRATARPLTNPSKSEKCYQAHVAIRCLASFLLGVLAAVPARADAPAYGPELEGFDYAWPAQRFDLESQRQKLHMSYLDVRPQSANGRTIVLLHGKNFCAGTWETTIRALSEAGWRVVAPDQIGFCKSSKPRRYQYSFQQLAENTRALLEHLGIGRIALLGHSTGGMLAVRFALLHPEQVERLILVNPIGLEDWKALGVPWRSVDQWYARELKTTSEGLRQYEQATYYAGQWRPEYDRWVEMLAGMYRGPGKEIVAWSSALLYDMIFTQPVLYELDRVQAPTLLLIGQKDNTAIGKDAAPPELKKKLGDYPRLGREAARRFPHATLVEFPELGHAPQIQDPARFHQALLAGLQ
jgi:pimeloyl-ACP methyl ester carboxylesterase